MERSCVYSLVAAALLMAGPLDGQRIANEPGAPRLIRFSGTVRDASGHPASGLTVIRFALYSEPAGSAPLWTETQRVPASSGGRFTALLGAASPGGLPAQLFITEQAHWVGVSVEGQAEQPRILLVSAPYALNTKDAETLGGLPPSAFLLSAPAVAAAVAVDGAKAVTARDVSPDTSCSKITSDGTATANEVSKFTAACVVEPSAIFESGGKVGIGTTTPAATLDVKGAATLRGVLTVNAKGAATAAAGSNSNPLDLLAASYASTTDTSIGQHFRWQAEAAANDTANPSGTLNLLYAPGSGTPIETGFAVSGVGLMTFATGQTFPGAGSITGVIAGSGLTGGGTAGAVTVGMTHACASGQVLEWNGSQWACAAVGTGTITGVTAGAGLSGGGSSGSVMLASKGVLSVAGGTGITSRGGNTPAVKLKTSFTDGRYLELPGGALSGPVHLAANGLTVDGIQLALAGGNAGIGTGAPGAPLEVAASVKISGAGSGLTFPDGSTQTTAGKAAVAGVNPLQAALLKWFPAYQSSASFTAGSNPYAAAFDGANIWVANFTSNNVTKLLASTGAVVGTYNVGGAPSAIAFDGANIWVANYGSNDVTELLAATGAQEGNISVGTGPAGLAFDGTNIWVANLGSNSVTKLVAATSAIVGTYNVGAGPVGVAFDGANIWVANLNDDTVTKLAGATGNVLGTYNVGSGPWGIAFDGAYIWVTNGYGNTVLKLLPSNGAVLATYTFGSFPQGIVFDGTYLWVTIYGDPDGEGTTVAKVLPSNGALVGTFNVGRGPLGIAFDGANVWVTNFQGTTVSKL